MAIPSKNIWKSQDATTTYLDYICYQWSHKHVIQLDVFIFQNVLIETKIKTAITLSAWQAFRTILIDRNNTRALEAFIMTNRVLLLQHMVKLRSGWRSMEKQENSDWTLKWYFSSEKEEPSLTYFYVRSGHLWFRKQRKESLSKDDGRQPEASPFPSQHALMI